MLQTLKDRLLEIEDTPLSELHLLHYRVGVDVLHPQVMVLCSSFCDMLFEDNHVGIRYLLAIDRGENGSRIVMDGVDEDRRASRQ